MENEIFEYGETKTLSKNTFTREGYTFVGWNTKSDGTGTAYPNELTITDLIPSGEITLYAQWTKNT